MIARTALCLALLGSAAPLAASPFDLNGLGEVTAERSEGLARVALPLGVFRDGAVPTEAAEGAVVRRAWRLPGDARTPLEILAPIRDRLEADSFEILFECDDVECGGFDFRYAIDLLPEPAMHVDLGDFNCLTARRSGDDGTPEHVAIIASRSSNAGFVHMIQVMPADADAVPRLTLSSRNARDPFVAELLGNGRAVLDGLSFGTGAAALSQGNFATLELLADWLLANPGRKVTLLGHTDSQGALATNIALSEARAAAVRDRLVNGYGIDPSQIAVRGLGPAEPRASNDTATGRRLNRRVEVQLN